MGADVPPEPVADPRDREEHDRRDGGLGQRAVDDPGDDRGEEGADDEPDEQPAEAEGLQREPAAVPDEAGEHEQSEQQEVEDVHGGRIVPRSGRSRVRRRGCGWAGLHWADVVTIAHISDPHVGSPYFVPNMMNRVIVELNELGPTS